MGIHLFIDKEDHRGHQYKDYTIYSDPLVTAWQAGVNACGIAA
jgi:hypothetical protein